MHFPSKKRQSLQKGTKRTPNHWRAIKQTLFHFRGTHLLLISFWCHKTASYFIMCYEKSYEGVWYVEV